MTPSKLKWPPNRSLGTATPFTPLDFQGFFWDFFSGEKSWRSAVLGKIHGKSVVQMSKIWWFHHLTWVKSGVKSWNVPSDTPTHPTLVKFWNCRENRLNRPFLKILDWWTCRPSVPTNKVRSSFVHTVDGGNLANQLRLVVYPIIYRVLKIPGGAGFLPSISWMFVSKFWFLQSCQYTRCINTYDLWQVINDFQWRVWLIILEA